MAFDRLIEIFHKINAKSHKHVAQSFAVYNEKLARAFNAQIIQIQINLLANPIQPRIWSNLNQV